MQTYRFRTDDGRAPPVESEFELVDISEAKAQAIRAAGEVLQDIGLGTVWDGVPWNMTVTDAEGSVVVEIQFRIKIHPHH